MAYPNNQAGKADNVALNPSLYTGVLNGLTNMAQAMAVLDGLNGPSGTVLISMPSAPYSPIQGLWGLAIGVGLMFNGSLYNVSDADGDAVEIPIQVPSNGTYTLYLNAPVDVDQGIVKLFLDEAAIGVLGGYDLYAAALDPAPIITVAALVLAAGEHKLKILVGGMNVASTNHYVRLHALELVRTA